MAAGAIKRADGDIARDTLLARGPITRALAVAVGLGAGGLWFLGSWLVLGLSGCLTEQTSSFCAEHADLLPAIEAAVILTGTLLPIAGGVLTASTTRVRWLAGALLVMIALAFCAERLVSVQESLIG